MKKRTTPPRLARALFSWYCKTACVEDLEGDLEELYQKNAVSMPLWKANANYWTMVISLMFSYAIKKRKAQSANHPFASANSVDMILNYFKVASRSLAKNRFFTIINVVGLSVGMSISLLYISMLSYVSNYDHFQENRDRIFRITTKLNDEVRLYDLASSPIPLGPKLKEDLPGIQESVRISNTVNGMAQTGKKEIPVSGYFAEHNFFDVFTYTMLKGNPKTALQKPMSIVLTESAASKLFGDEEALAKSIVIDPWGNFEVTGIIKDHPRASHLFFEVIASYNSLPTTARNKEDWKEFRNHYTYLLFSPETDPQEIQPYLDRLADDRKINGDEKSRVSFSLQSINSIALGRDLVNEIGPEWGILSFIIFGVLNLLILLPACFNYANLSISRALKRAKEIGLRKTVGGRGSQIFAQFITETIIVTLIALAGSFLIFTQIRQEFLSMLVSSDGLELKADPITILYFILFAITTGFLAGVVPALYFARLNPVQALKNMATQKQRTRFSFQKILVVSQFALSLGFIMGVVIVIKQYRASLNYNFGFEQANVLDVELQDADIERFRHAFSSVSPVQQISMSSGIIGTSLPPQSTIQRAEDTADSADVYQFFIDSHYLENLKIKLIAGTSFPQENGKQREHFIIVNEEFLKQFKIPGATQALNQNFILDDSIHVTIIGVVSNFHYTSLTEPIRSFIFRSDPKKYAFANLTVQSQDLYEAIDQLESTWKSIGATTPFRSRFFQDEIQETYSFYFSLIKICGFLGFLAITISCLGLLGMVVYTTENRMKELGIRKVMGADFIQLAVLLSKGYLKLMAIAAFIAIPITYLIFDKGMLQMQYYRFEIGVGEIVVSLLIMLVLGGSTILSQTLKAAATNPVDTLKSE